MNELYLKRIMLKEDCEAEKSYVWALPVVRHLKEITLRSPVTFFCGENGTGKSTLLEALAVHCGFNAEGGTKNFNFATNETHSPLYHALSVAKGRRPRDGFFLRAESFYNVATEIDRLDAGGGLGRPVIDSYGGVSLHHQSHGESFLSLLLNRFGGEGLYLLDEPEAALSPARQMTLLARMHELAEQRSQFIIATHSPILMAYPGAEIYVLTPDGMEKTPYEQTEHYLLTRRFLENPGRMLAQLFEEGPGDSRATGEEYE